MRLSKASWPERGGQEAHAGLAGARLSRHLQARCLGPSVCSVRDELGGQQTPSPILAMCGPPGRPRPDPPHPAETPVSVLTAVFHWPATAATAALVPPAECSTTFSWHPRPAGRSGKLLYL